MAEPGPGWKFKAGRLKEKKKVQKEMSTLSSAKGYFLATSIFTVIAVSHFCLLFDD